MHSQSLFFIIAITLWSGINFYLGLRIVRPIRVKSLRQIGWGMVVANLIALPLIFTLQRRFGFGNDLIPLLWVGYLGAGFAMTAFPLFGVIDIVRYIGTAGPQFVKAFSNPTNRKSAEGTAVFDPARRLFLTNSVAVATVGVSGGLTGVGFYRARRAPELVVVDVPIVDLHPSLEGFTIGQLSDTHIGPTIRKNAVQQIVDLINGIDADLIAVTGDLSDGQVIDLEPELAPFKELRSRHGVYFVTGNHEYYWDIPGWQGVVERIGWVNLINDHRLLDHNGARFVVAGVTDFTAERYVADHRSDSVKAVAHAPVDRHFTLMLAHQPRSAPDVVKVAPDLVLSGHTHGGQFIPWSFVVPYFHPVLTGFNYYEGIPFYVNRGSGYWGPPLRSGSEPEVTMIRLMTKLKT
jgi:hypothetical protein